MDIIRYSELQKIDGLFFKEIHGLNIIWSNRSEIPADPVVAFYQHFSSKYSCSIQLGPLCMLDQTPDDFFANASERIPYLTTTVELWIGKFELNLKGSSGCFIPYATAWLWNQYGKYMKAYDALAVYAGGDESRLTRAIDLFRNPQLSVNGDFQSYWLSQMTELFPLVLINGHDGYHIDCYACDQQAFKLMDDSIAYATDFISRLSWYQQHKEELVWSDYWSCLTFPQYKDGP